MVAHFSSKLSHLSNPFRSTSQQTFSFTRNAFPSSGTFTANPVPTQGHFTSNALGGPSPHQPGAGAGGNAGSAGGSKRSTGNRGSSWAFQSQGRYVAQQAQDPNNSRLDDEDDLRALRRPSLLRSRQVDPLSRRENASLPPPSDRVELLRFEDASTTAALAPLRIRPSQTEMQLRYGKAFASGRLSREVIEEIEKEADEMELELELESNVLRSGRRASVSGSRSRSVSRSFLATTSSPIGHSSSLSTPLRAVHTSSSAAAPSASSELPASATQTSSQSTTSPFDGVVPPRATVPRVRRNSTSAFERSPPRTDASPPLASPDFLAKAAKTRKARPEPLNGRRPPATHPGDKQPNVERKPLERYASKAPTPEQKRVQAIKDALERGQRTAVQAAIRVYLAHEATYTINGHNAAMDALLHTAEPGASLNQILELYNQLFDHDLLRPNVRSYDIVITALARADENVVGGLEHLENRRQKKELSAMAKGIWFVPTKGKKVLPIEEQKLAELQQSDFLTPALEIYKSLGKQSSSLSRTTYSALIASASARDRVDLAISLFQKVEQLSPHLLATRMFHPLIRLFGRAKDAESVLLIFNRYLEARSQGMLSGERAVMPGRMSYRAQPTKHRYTAETQWVAAPVVGGVRGGDPMLWGETMIALAEAGDSAGSVQLLERLITAQEATSETPLPAGYPREVTPYLLSNIVESFIIANDEGSARNWFQQSLPAPGTAMSGFWTTPLYRAINASQIDLASEICRSMIERTDVPLDFSAMIAVVDANLAVVYRTDNVDVKNKALDHVVEFSTKYLERARAEGAGKDAELDSLSTGQMQRIAVGLATTGRYEDAVKIFLDLISRVTPFLTGEAVAPTRNAAAWARNVVETAAGVCGMVPVGKKFGFASREAPRAPLSVMTSVVAALDVARPHFTVSELFDVSIVEAYLKAKGSVADVQALELTPNQWFVTIQAFASVAAHEANGGVPPVGFPGFEPIIEDFVVSEVALGDSSMYDYHRLVKALKITKMENSRIVAVLAYLDPTIVEKVAAGEVQARNLVSSRAPAAQPIVDAASEISSSSLDAAPNTDFASVTATDPTSAFDSAIGTLPTPPSTPPTYFAELPTPPPEAPQLTKVDIALTAQLESMLEAKPLVGYSLAVDGAAAGKYAHPEVLARLIEFLGRDKRVDEARHVYMLAYNALPALARSPDEQALAWVTLEDRMIIALAYSGRLEDVAVHRLRLLEAGSAPSADGYAAMILNMHETTNDAAVALQLFEESQTHGVAPNVYLFNTLISKLSRARRRAEAIVYFEMMKEKGLKPTAITYGALINACCKTGDDVTADFLFAEMSKLPGFKPRVPPYNTMIQFYTSTKPDRERALFYYDKLLEAGVRPTGHTYKLLLDAYGSVGIPDAHSMSDVFEQLVKDQTVTVTGAHWGSLVHAWGCVQRNLDHAVAIFDSIATHRSTAKSKSPLPDAVCYESLLNAFVANGRPELCDKYVQQMEQRGVRMTAYVANTLIKARIALGDMDGARKLFDSLSDPVAGAAAAGNHTVNRHPKHHTPTSAAPAPEGIVFREPSTYDTMIRAEVAAGESSRAAELMKKLEERAFPEAVVQPLRKLLLDSGIETLV
ncbi:pentatricopeptide repeat protein [Pseudohyphozyma bogoriensis]|nr:pentatricopeptide repeat protein [Pseudohyphozyma bogoriensis]